MVKSQAMVSRTSMQLCMMSAVDQLYILLRELSSTSKRNTVNANSKPLNRKKSANTACNAAENQDVYLNNLVAKHNVQMFLEENHPISRARVSARSTKPTVTGFMEVSVDVDRFVPSKLPMKAL
jgi:hypothetical protein